MSKSHSSNTINSFSEVSVGDLLNGATIDQVILSDDDYCIFVSNKELGYSYRNLSQLAIEKLNELDINLTKAFKKFGHIHSDIIDKHRTSIVSLILSSDLNTKSNITTINEAIDALEQYIETEEKPELILATNLQYSVYLDENYLAKYTIRNSQLYISDTLDEFYRLRAWGAVALEQKKAKLLNLKLATCLAIGFRSKLSDPDSDTKKIFNSAALYIEKTINDSASHHLIVSTAISSLVIMAITTILYFSLSTPTTLNLNTFLIGITGGTCGALISVLQRAQKLQVNLYEQNKTIAIQGIVRLGLGCVFGVISLIACKSGLLLNVMSGSNSKLLILAIIAGFSERLIPDFIEKTGNKNQESNAL